MDTLELEIGQQVPPELHGAMCYSVNINIVKGGHFLDSCRDELHVETETKRTLEAFLTCFDKTLKEEQCEQIEETTEKVNALLLSVGLTEDEIKRLFLREALALGIGHLLLEGVLLTGEEFQARYEKIRCQADSFRLRLIIRPQSLRKWPWEFLWDKSLLVDDSRQYYDGFLGISRNKTVSHSLGDIGELPCSQLLERPLRMLFAIARPEYRDEIKFRRKLGDVVKTERLIQIRAALRGWCKVINLDAQREDAPNSPDETKIEIYIADHISWQRLQGILKKHGEQPFDVFHYVGHAWFSNDESKGFCLALESEEDRRVAKEITAAEIGEALAGHGTSLVLLNACETSQERETAEGIAQTIASCGVPAVIGMRYGIRGIDNINFAETFFAGLLDGKRIDFLVNDTRNAMARRFIFDDLYEGRVFKRGIHYLYPTVHLHPSDGFIFFTEEPPQHTAILRKLERAIQYLASSKSSVSKAAQEALLEYPHKALGPLWIALLSDIDPIIQREVANVLSRTGDELAAYPLAEALVNTSDADVQKSCEEALKELGQSPAALCALVDQYANINTSARILEVINAINPFVAENAVWLQISTDLYRAVKDFYEPIAFLTGQTRLKKANIIDLISDLESIYRRYHGLRQKEIQIYNEIKSADESIDRQIAGLSDRTVRAIIEREERREEKDRIDQRINTLLDSFLDSTYHALTEVLDYLELNEVGLRALKQALDEALQRRLELPNDIPTAIRENVEEQTERLNALREELQAFLETESTLRQIIRTVQNFRDGFSPIGQ